MDAGEQKALDDIARHGCHIINVLAEGELSEFSYSVGIQQSTQRPEAIVIGLKHPMVGSSGESNTCLQYSRGRLKTQRLPRTLIQP